MIFWIIIGTVFFLTGYYVTKGIVFTTCDYCNNRYIERPIIMRLWMPVVIFLLSFIPLLNLFAFPIWVTAIILHLCEGTIVIKENNWYLKILFKIGILIKNFFNKEIK